LGLFLCGASIRQTLSPQTKFWDLALDCRKQLQRSLPTGYQTIGLLSFVPDITKLLRDRLKGVNNARCDSLEISNLLSAPLQPTYQNPQGSVQEVKACYFGQPNHYWGPLFSISLVSHQKTLTFSVGTAAPLVSDQQAALFRDMLLFSLTHAITNPELCLDSLF